MPVKGAVSAKSRLGATPSLAAAIALDTVEAAAAVCTVIVVTTGVGASDFEALGALVVADPGGGLNAAVAAGVAAAGPGPVAVLLGDLPALLPAELAAALALAAEHPLAFVADADGTGTVLVTALRASDHRPAFGMGSRAAHLAAGYFELDVAETSGLRRDVDTKEQLATLAVAGRLGARTSARVK